MKKSQVINLNNLLMIKKTFFSKLPWVAEKIFEFSKYYIANFHAYKYNPKTNGEYYIVKKVAKLFNKKFFFFDVGANVGNWTKHVISNYKNYEGHLFEISNKTFFTLKKNFQKSKSKSKNIFLNNFGLFNKNINVNYKNFGKDDGGNTILLNSNYFDKKKYSIMKAKVIRGDDYLKKLKINRINFLKIDVEGAEYFVLNGFKEAFRKKKIDLIQFEYGYTHADAKSLMKDFFNFFEKNGYIVGRLESNGVYFKKFEYTDNDFKSGPNYIACLPKFKKHLEK